MFKCQSRLCGVWCAPSATHCHVYVEVKIKLSTRLLFYFLKFLCLIIVIYRHITEWLCCIPKALVGWERRMWNALTEREVLSALEHLRIEIQVHRKSRWCVNSFLIYYLKMYLSIAIRLTPGGSSTVYIYTQTIHRTTQTIHRTKQITTEQHK